MLSVSLLLSCGHPIPAMFLKHDDRPSFLDLSLFVRDITDWKVGILKDTEFPLDITIVAFDPVSCLLAIGDYHLSSLRLSAFEAF